MLCHIWSIWFYPKPSHKATGPPHPCFLCEVKITGIKFLLSFPRSSKYPSPYFLIFIHVLNDLYAQHGVQTHNPEIKSCMLYQLSHPGAPHSPYFLVCCCQLKLLKVRHTEDSGSVTEPIIPIMYRALSIHQALYTLSIHLFYFLNFIESWAIITFILQIHKPRSKVIYPKFHS